MDRGPFPRLILTVKMVNGVVNGWTICYTSIIFQTFSLLFALQETGYRKASEMEVPGYIVSGRDHGKTQILCPRPFVG